MQRGCAPCGGHAAVAAGGAAPAAAPGPGASSSPAPRASRRSAGSRSVAQQRGSAAAAAAARRAACATARLGYTAGHAPSPGCTPSWGAGSRQVPRPGCVPCSWSRRAGCPPSAAAGGAQAAMASGGAALWQAWALLLLAAAAPDRKSARAMKRSLSGDAAPAERACARRALSGASRPPSYSRACTQGSAHGAQGTQLSGPALTPRTYG